MVRPTLAVTPAAIENEPSEGETRLFELAAFPAKTVHHREAVADVTRCERPFFANQPCRCRLSRKLWRGNRAT